MLKKTRIRMTGSYIRFDVEDSIYKYTVCYLAIVLELISIATF